MDWREFWNSFPKQFKEGEFLRQVGKTFRGQPISAEQFGALISDVVTKLSINSQDVVLDLGCGNGLITAAIAGKCRWVTGVDFSRPLIEVARARHAGPNIAYYLMSVLDISAEAIQASEPFTKICMYEALQHFDEAQLAALLPVLVPLSTESTVMLLASVPDEERILQLYDSAERLREHEVRRREAREWIGWWNKSSISRVCEAHGWRCEFLPQDPILHTARYRFDVRMTRR